MIQHLEKIGISDVVCNKITPKDGKQFKTAAIFVSCNVKYEFFYKDSTWPEGAEVRDWVFRNN